jgi:hypothetical protein
LIRAEETVEAGHAAQGRETHLPETA